MPRGEDRRVVPQTRRPRPAPGLRAPGPTLWRAAATRIAVSRPWTSRLDVIRGGAAAVAPSLPTDRGNPSKGQKSPVRRRRIVVSWTSTRSSQTRSIRSFSSSTRPARPRRCSRRFSKTSRSGETLSTSSAWNSSREDRTSALSSLPARGARLDATFKGNGSGRKRATPAQARKRRRSQRRPTRWLQPQEGRA
jgi:hypothetical protein